MKCLSLFAVLTALTLVPVASAQQSKRDKETARKNAALARFTQRAANQPAAAARSQNVNRQRAQNFGNQARRTRQFQQTPGGTQPNFNRTRRGGRNFNVDPGSTSAQTRVYSGRQFNGERRRNFGRNRGDFDGNVEFRGNRPGANQNPEFNRGRGTNREWNRHRGGRHHGNWDRRHRSRNWWRNHYSRFALFGGGYYYWDSGYWYPAYGYDPYFTTYVYDAPIYGYNDLEPGAVIAQVQVELQRRGYDPGPADGDYGPATRGALLDYQRDNGLPVTGEIDQPTLESLGLE